MKQAWISTLCVTLLSPLMALAGMGHAHRASSPAFQDIPGFAEALKNANFTLQTAPAKPTLSSLFTDAQVNSCLESVCGTARQNQADSDTLQSRTVPSVQFKRFWENARPAFDRQMHEKAQFYFDLGTKLKGLVANGTKLDPSHAGRTLIVYANAVQTVGAQLLEISDYSQENSWDLSVHPGRFKHIHGQRTAEERALFHYIASTYLMPELTRSLMRQRFGLPMNLVTELRHARPEIPAQQATKDLAKAVLKGQERLFAAIGFGRDGGFLSEELLQKIAKDGIVPASEEPTFWARSQQVLMWSAAFAPAVKAVIDRIPFDESAAMKILMALPIENATNLEQSRGDLSLGLAPAMLFEQCKHRLLETDSSSVSPMMLRIAKENVAAIRDAAKAAVKTLVHSQVAPFFEKEIDSVVLRFPDAGSSAVADFERLARGRDREHLRRQTALDDSSAGGIQKLLYNALFESITRGKMAYLQNLSNDSVAQFCSGIEVGTVTDMMDLLNNAITISWFSVSDPEKGLGIIAHELGHLLSQKLPQVKEGASNYPPVRQCVRDRNPFSDFPAKGEDSLYTEEDWADFFAMLVLRELKTMKNPWMKNGRSNFACIGIRDLGNKYSTNVFEPIPRDNHSSALLRVLMLGHDLGETTPACAPLLKAIGERANGRLDCRMPPFKSQ